MAQLSCPRILLLHDEDPIIMAVKMGDISAFKTGSNNLCETAELPPRVKTVRNYLLQKLHFHKPIYQRKNICHSLERCIGSQISGHIRQNPGHLESIDVLSS